jgi:ferredoxin
MVMKVSVNSEVCEGYGNCARIAPEVFQLDEAGYSQVLHDGQVPEGQSAAAEYAVQDCPMSAISADEE